jgi:hypothetical protein
MLKQSLGKINNFLKSLRFRYSENEMPVHQLENIVFKTNYHLIGNTFTTSFLNFYHHPFKIKKTLQIINNWLFLTNNLLGGPGFKTHKTALFLSLSSFPILFMYSKVI